MKLIFEILFLSFFTYISHSQEGITITIEKTEDSSNQGKSSGEKMIEYQSYNVFDIVSDLTDISTEEFIASDNASKKNIKINLTAESNNTINKDSLRKKVFSLLKINFDIKITIKKETLKKFTFLIDHKKVNKYSSDNYNGSSLSLTGKKLIGNCITLNQFKDVVTQWYNESVYINQKNELIKFNVDMIKNKTWDMFRLELAGNVGIDIIKKEIEVPVIYVN